MKSLIFTIILFASSISFSQEGYLELFRRDMKTDKLKLIIAAMDMPDASAKKFWPIYREYDQELMKIGDRMIANIKDYASSETTLSDDRVDDLVSKAFSIREDRLALLRKYYKKAKKELGPKIAARFVQAENQILTLIDAKVNDAVPLVKVP